MDEDTLEAFVPSMLLQPIVENSIKHGLAAKIEGGQITIRTSLLDGRLVIEVEDNGVGIPEDRMAQVYVDGIGISNVHERLRVLYGADFRMDISSREGAGTLHSHRGAGTGFGDARHDVTRDTPEGSAATLQGCMVAQLGES